VKKILAVFRKFNYYGAVNNSLDLLLNLDNSKYDITIIFLKRKSNQTNARYINLLDKKKISYIFLDEIFFLNYKIIQKIPNFLKEIFIKKNWAKFFKNNNNFDYYYLNDHLTDYKYILQKLTIDKIIFHIHYSKNLFNFSKEIIESYKNAKLNLVNNILLKNDLVKLGVIERKIHHMNIAVDYNNWCFDNKNYQYLKKKYDIKPDQLVIGGSGSISSRKGADIFNEVFKIIKKNNLENKVKFFWLGDLSSNILDKSEDEIKMKKEYSKFSLLLREKMVKNKIQVLKASKNPFFFFNMLDVLIISSRKEVGPLTMLESMCLEKIVISHKDCGAASVVLDKNSGTLLPENNPILYFNAIKKILDNKNNFNEIKKNARKNIIENFSIVNEVKKIEKLL
tara:strand:- start:113 stop:1297 length:1185 start_codon:yes stop_codon:yes gene_type:complete